MINLLVLIVSLMLSTSALAAIQSITIDTSTWDQRQKNLLTAAVIKESYAINNTIKPPISVNSNTGEVVFQDPPFNVSVLTTQLIFNAVNQIIIDSTQTPDQIKADEVIAAYNFLEKVLAAYTQVLKAKNPTLIVSNMKQAVIDQMKINEGLTP